MTQSSDPEQQLTNEPPATSKIFEEVQRREQEELRRKEQEEAQRKEQERIHEEEQRRKQEQSNKDVNVDTQIDPRLLQEWPQFDSIISNLESSRDADTSKAADT